MRFALYMNNLQEREITYPYMFYQKIPPLVEELKKCLGKEAQGIPFVFAA